MEILGSLLQGDTAILVFILICFVALMVMFYKVARGLDEVSKALDSQRDEEMKVIAVQVRENLALLVRYQREANKTLEALAASGAVGGARTSEPRTTPSEHETPPVSPLREQAGPKRAVAAAAAGLAASVAMAGVADTSGGEEAPDEGVSFDLEPGLVEPEAAVLDSDADGDELDDFQVAPEPMEAEEPLTAALLGVEKDEHSFISLAEEGGEDEFDVSDLMDIEDESLGAPEVQEEDDDLLPEPEEMRFDEPEEDQGGDADLPHLDEQLTVDSISFSREQEERLAEGTEPEEDLDLGFDEATEVEEESRTQGLAGDEDLVFSDSLGLVPDVDDLSDDTGPQLESLTFSPSDEEVDVHPASGLQQTSPMDETLLEAMDEEIGLPDEEIVLLESGDVEEDDSLLLAAEDIHEEITTLPDDESDITIDRLDPHRPSEFSLQSETEADAAEELEEPHEQHIDFGPEDDDQDLDMLIEDLVDVHEDDAHPDDDSPALETELVLDDEEDEPETVLDIPVAQGTLRPEAPTVISMDDEEEDDLGETLSLEDFETILEDRGPETASRARETETDEDILEITAEDDDIDLDVVHFGVGQEEQGDFDQPLLDETVPDISVSEFAPDVGRGLKQSGQEQARDDDVSFDLGDLDLLLEDNLEEPAPGRKQVSGERSEKPPMQFSAEDMDLDFDYEPEPPPARDNPVSPSGKDARQTAKDEDDFIDFIIDDEEEGR
jgi:hypothetical protein